MSGMNEVLRQEKKFLITLEQFYRHRARLLQVMALDAHSRGDGYPIRSLYFDTLDDQDFQEKEDGVELRRKLRLRCYGPDTPFAILEMKQKQGPMQKKRSLRLSREEAGRLAAGDYAPLVRRPEAFAHECYALMNLRCYRPAAVVEYRRQAFVAKENRIRVTFDHHITATESRFDLFAPDLALNSVLDPGLAVLEVKYNGFLLSYIKDLLLACDGSESSVSKYCLGRGISKHYRF